MTRSLEEMLFTEGYRFDFFQAVRLLGRLDRGSSIGLDQSPHREFVRFRCHNTLAFPAAPVHSIRKTSDGPPRMWIAFMGLTGRLGELPFHYTEFLIRRRHDFNDTTAAEFFDLFAHRFVSLYYRAWEKHYLPAQYDNERRLDSVPDSGISQYLCDLIGMGTPVLRRMLLPEGRVKARRSEAPQARPLPRAALLYAGLLAQQPHSAAALEGMLRDYLNVPVAIEQFRGAWRRLPPSEVSCLLGESMANCLGEGAAAGDEVWNVQAGIRIHLGPLSYRDYRRFARVGSPDLQAIRRLARFFLGDSITFDIEPALRAKEVPACALGAGDPELGLDTWLATEPFSTDARDLILQGSEI
jgi:type VI secretion system protein ImpH